MPAGVERVSLTSLATASAHADVILAYRYALSTTFLAGAVVAAIACLVVAMSPERPLAEKRQS
jgi:hypothetical protein